jgi:hypothetical protein
MVKLGQPIQNVDASSNVETRGMMVCGEMDITSYDSGGEVVNAAELGLNEIYNMQMQAEELDTYAVRSCTVASNRKSAVINVDTAGSGTEVTSTTDIGRHSFIAWGEDQGSGSN